MEKLGVAQSLGLRFISTCLKHRFFLLLILLDQNIVWQNVSLPYPYLTFMVTAVSSLPLSRADSMISLRSGQYMLIVPAAFRKRKH